MPGRGKPATLESDPVALGARLRSLRKQRGLTQGQVVGEDISIAYLSRIEAGQRKPEGRVLRLLAGRLGTSVEFLTSGVSPDVAAELDLLLSFAELSLRNGEPGAAAQQARELLERPDLDHSRLPAAKRLLAQAAEAQGEYGQSIQLLEEMMADSPLDLLTATTLTRCYREAGDLSRSIEVAQEALDRCEEMGLGYVEETVQLLVTMAAAYAERGDVLHATTLCERAVEHGERLGSARARASAYWNSSMVIAERSPTQALSLARKALALLSEGDDARLLARLNLQIGLLLTSQEPPDLQAAEKQLLHARRGLLEASAGAASLSRCDAALALVRLDAGDVEGAEDLARSAQSHALDAPLADARANYALGRVALARGARADARLRFTAAAAALRHARAERQVSQLWFELATWFDSLGDSDSALDCFRLAGSALGLRATSAPSPATAPAGR